MNPKHSTFLNWLADTRPMAVVLVNLVVPVLGMQAGTLANPWRVLAWAGSALLLALFWGVNYGNWYINVKTRRS